MMDRSGRNVTAGVAMKEAGRFLAAAPGLGLRGSTVLKLAKQVAGERVNRNRVVRRRTSQVQIAFDFFLKELRRNTPEAAFFFTNHAASAQHRYWPALFPDDYREKFWTPQWQTDWNGEIEFALSEASDQIEQLMRFVNRDSRYALMVTSSMGQAAVEQSEAVRSQLYLADMRRLMRLLGFSDEEWRRERMMAPRYTITVPPQLADVAVQRLGELRINGEQISIEAHGHGVVRFKLGQVNLDTASIDVRLGDRRLSLEEAGLENTDIQDETGSYAYHIPEGSLLLYDPASHVPGSIDAKRISTLEIAPAILANFGIARPSYMAAPAAILHGA